jgi:protein O-GlcNAc transferase
MRLSPIANAFFLAMHEGIMTAIAEKFAQALRHHQAGSLGEAERLYRQILQAEPEHADANHLLGVLAYQGGHCEQAVTLIGRAISVSPRAACYHSNLGLALEELGQVDAAVGSYLLALRLEPDFPEAHNNLGKALLHQGRRDEAVTHFREALSIRPDFPEALVNLANALLSLGKHDEAICCYRQALRSKPDCPEAHRGLGFALEQQDKLDEAAFHYQISLRLDPGNAEAHNGLGHVFKRQQKLDLAVVWFQKALELNPHFAQTHYNLGCSFLEQGRCDLALESLRNSLRADPDLALAQSCLLFCLNYDPRADLDAVFAEHCNWGKIHHHVPDICGGHTNDCHPERRLRIGYVSPDLRFHALARYIEPVLANHDRELVEVYCYAEVHKPDAVTTRVQGLVHGWRSTCRLLDADVANMIRRDKIDILVDLAGHTRDSRLLVFAQRPAPIQISWLGYMNTTGLPAIDYRLTDAVLDPPTAPTRDTEELFRLPDGMCCFAPPVDAPAVSPLPALTNRRITFGSLNSVFKLNCRVIDLWSKVLKAVPDSRLIMFHHTLTGTAREHIRRQFEDHGTASDRLDLRRGNYSPGYLGVYKEIDVSLDTFPCTGGVTTCEALWMGVPVLSLCGVRPAGRNSAAILARVGLGDFVIQSSEQYVAAAVKLATDFDHLACIRTRLRERMHKAICDAPRFTRELENAYRTMWRRWCSQVKEPSPPSA